MALSKIDGMKPRLLQDFIIPHLTEGTFGDKLCWVDRRKGIFRISWRHQSSSRFSVADSCVFQGWAMVKGLWNPREEKCHTKAKQRLRAALLKLKSVKCLRKDNESRIYQIISNEDLINDNGIHFEQPSLENRPIFDYQPSDGMEIPDFIFEEFETEHFINQLLNPSSSNPLRENFNFQTSAVS